ncbi:hypothetical protein N8I77_010286 [Diaporthe amygdali]|uniref:O-methyltransferase C-terminal domain-containing protein n=1 Tax=Phomopsis amygdali TaxID=1214568 RepID=A0AAD9W1N6_PHOAM|nr:hypothetical protein N8I77_010286 [Diaporthe amygdali]
MANNSDVVDQIVATLDGVNLDQVDSDPGARMRVIDAARRMLARVETPFERMWHVAQVNITLTAACRILVDIGLFEAWREAGGKDALLMELWELCRIHCDMALLRRLLRLCVAANMVEEVDEDHYRATAFSLALGIPGGPVVESLNGAFHHTIPSTSNLPKWLARNHYEAPNDPKNTPYMDISPGKLGIFETWAKEPSLQASFIGMMVGFADMRMDWTDIYDTDRLVEGYDFGNNDGTLLVDVGGAQGVDVKRLLDKQPQIPLGHIVLQDLPDVVGAAVVDDRVEIMGHDFFQEQPVIGARAYLMHAVLHDWDDIEARRILKHVARAMKEGYSKLLICDVVIPPKGASLYQAVQDVSLLHLLSAAERSEERWIKLLKRAHFEVVRFWTHDQSPECVIEAQLAATKPQNKQSGSTDSDED